MKEDYQKGLENFKNFKNVSFEPHVVCISFAYTSMSCVCHLCVLVCHSYVTRMYSYVIRMSLVCTRMSSVCYSYVVLPWTSFEAINSETEVSFYKIWYFFIVFRDSFWLKMTKQDIEKQSFAEFSIDIYTWILCPKFNLKNNFQRDLTTFTFRGPVTFRGPETSDYTEKEGINFLHDFMEEILQNLLCDFSIVLRNC